MDYMKTVLYYTLYRVSLTIYKHLFTYFFDIKAYKYCTADDDLQQSDTLVGMLPVKQPCRQIQPHASVPLALLALWHTDK